MPILITDMANLQQSLIVELYIDGARIVGLLGPFDERRRLLEELNSADDAILLASADVRLTGTTESHRIKSLSVDKKAILFAVPRETQEQIRSRQMFRTGLSPITSDNARIKLLMPPFILEGTTRVSLIDSYQRVNLASFTRFFAITSATLKNGDEPSREESVILVNRDRVIAIGRTDEAERHSGSAFLTSWR